MLEKDLLSKRKLQFGFALPQGWRWLDDIPGTTSVKQYEFSKKIAQTADRLGYDSAYAYDHFIPYFKQNLEVNFFECYILLSAIAASTKKLRMGQIVTCNSYRNPALLTKMLSTMDVISNGRVELGIGAGWYEEEYRSYGYDYPSNTIRVKQLDESLSIIKAMWTERRATFSGQYFSVKDAICNPKPVQKPHPTIMVGGSGEKYLLRVAAKHADRYNHPFGYPEELKRKISILKAHCDDVGRDHKEIELSVVIRCLIRETEEEIQKQINSWKGKDETIEQFKKRIDGQAAIGTPEQVISRLNEYIDLGLTHFIIHFIGLNERTLRLFDSKVIKKI
jgi:F420-dependent oxidoreductase-like protein